MRFHDTGWDDVGRENATFSTFAGLQYDLHMRCRTLEGSAENTPQESTRYKYGTPSRIWADVDTDREDHVSSIDLRSPTGGVGPDLIPPQFVVPISAPPRTNNHILSNGDTRWMQHPVTTRPNDMTPTAVCTRQPIPASVVAPARPSQTPASLQHSSAAETESNITVLQPGELLRKSQYAFLPKLLREGIDLKICELWVVANHPSTKPEIKASTMAHIRVISHRVYEKQQEAKEFLQQALRGKEHG